MVDDHDQKGNGQQADHQEEVGGEDEEQAETAETYRISPHSVRLPDRDYYPDRWPSITNRRVKIIALRMDEDGPPLAYVGYVVLMDDDGNLRIPWAFFTSEGGEDVRCTVQASGMMDTDWGMYIEHCKPENISFSIIGKAFSILAAIAYHEGICVHPADVALVDFPWLSFEQAFKLMQDSTPHAWRPARDSDQVWEDEWEEEWEDEDSVG